MTRVLAIDVGYGNTKVVFDDPKAVSGSTKYDGFCFRSVAPSISSPDINLATRMNTE
jgi:hypothetical protein